MHVSQWHIGADIISRYIYLQFRTLATARAFQFCHVTHGVRPNQSSLRIWHFRLRCFLSITRPLSHVTARSRVENYWEPFNDSIWTPEVHFVYWKFIYSYLSCAYKAFSFNINVDIHVFVIFAWLFLYFIYFLPKKYYKT